MKERESTMDDPIKSVVAAAQEMGAPGDETLRLVGVIADKIEDGTLFQAGLFSRRDLAEKVRAVVRCARHAPTAEVVAWRERFPQYEYRPHDDCISLKMEGAQPVASTCVACEGNPAPGNSPCAVCRKIAVNAEPSNAAIEAIQFALGVDEGLTWLRCWNEGDFDACRNEWPEAPEACYIGADPLHPGTKAMLEPPLTAPASDDFGNVEDAAEIRRVAFNQAASICKMVRKPGARTWNAACDECTRILLDHASSSTADCDEREYQD